jgi:PAS domain S-box-containing protein
MTNAVTTTSTYPGSSRVSTPVKCNFVVSAGLVGVYLISLIIRRTGSYYTPVDGWGVSGFEVAVAVMCASRFFYTVTVRGRSGARIFPLVLGTACLAWALGDTTLTIESLGGATATIPSPADAFYIGFFPLAYLALMTLIRRGNRKSLVATSLDGLIAGFGVASVSAAYLFHPVVRATRDTALAAATQMAYPVGDLLLLALAIGALGILPREYRRVLIIAGIAFAANSVGDLFNLLQPASKIGYIANGVAWPTSLLMLALAGWSQPAKTVQALTTEKVKTERTAGFAVPAVGAFASLLVLVSASLGHIERLAVALAAATLLVAGVRLTLTVREARTLNSARFRSLIDNAWDIIVVAEADFEVAFITPSSERVLGYPPAELQGRPISGLVHPDDVDALFEHLRLLGDGTGETAAFETRMRRRDGAWRIIAWTATNLLADPSVGGYVLNGGDVTEARQAAEDLAAARDSALMASKAKSAFLSTMSHEIRTPMNGVIGLTELLLDTNLDPDQQELASGVKVSAENLLVIINDILDFSKVEAGKLELDEAPLSVAGVADDVGRILAGTAHTKGLELLVDVDPEVPSALLGDVVRIQQVLLNLASNAVKFTSAGEVVVRVSVLHENIERVALRFEVIDMGIGIALADQERLFHAFAQADSSTTRQFGGTGLGLAICRQLVELMGGKLGLISAPGEGSTFWFELSLCRAETVALGDADANPRDLVGRLTLIVDDNATNRKILRQQLRSWGVGSVEAADGFEAIRLAVGAADAGEGFDLAVIDLNMPGMDGMELAGILKADAKTAPMALFLLSSSGERLSAAECHLRGFAGSLTKPVRPSELFDCVISSLNEPAPPVLSTPPSADPAQHLEVKGMILLVEDNKMNQLVGSKALEKLGFQFDIANHGGEAVRACQAQRYDAVLMDCQMPEMDGYEATAEIRRLEGTTCHTPIIAMTAAAMEGDRETCLAAGMDDYITKPVRLEAIATVLARWIARPAPAQSTAGPGPGSDDRPDALDPTQIEILRSLDDGDGAVLGEIIDQFLTQTAEGRDELFRVVGTGDSPAVERAAHTLRGASANVGAKPLSAICAELEQRGRAGQLDEAGGLVDQFDAEFERVRAALRSLDLVATGT